MGKIIGGVLAFIVLIFAITIIGGSYYTVDQGARGIILTNGAVTGVAEPGFGFKTPIITRVVDMSVQDQNVQYPDIQAWSSDQQVATLKLSVSYQVLPDQVKQVYSDYGSIDNLLSRVLDRQVNKVAEEVFSQYTAPSAIQNRKRLGVEFQNAIIDSVTGAPFVIKSVQVEDISFSDDYEKATRDRAVAELQVRTAQQTSLKAQVDAEREARVTVTNAQAAADAQVTSAKAQAETTKLQGEAQAEITRLNGEAEGAAIKAKADALASNPALIGLTQAERWDGKLPTTMVPGATIPFMEMKATAP